ncbi:MAG: hypothetical protein LBT97_01965, partial [Planctomycetota bacterium]|nr:hypothetical protein [Planctomycetota bacterium]
MRILPAVALLLLCCCGCRQAARSNGGFADVKSPDLVEDAITTMLSAYPPARTRLALLHPADDAFGAGLTEALRGNGYAVAEYAAPARAISRTDAPPPDGLEFAYILD